MTDQKRDQVSDNRERGSTQSQQPGSDRETPDTADDRGNTAGGRDNDQLEGEVDETRALDEAGDSDDELDNSDSNR